MVLPSFLPLSSSAWPQFELLDYGNGRRLERWGSVQLIRPDVAAVGRPGLEAADWEDAAWEFVERRGKSGVWRSQRGEVGDDLPTWSVPLDVDSQQPLQLELRLTPYKHVGVFPEQFSQWQWMDGVVREAAARRREPPRLLNLFAYTGVASLVAARAGAVVTHVEASKSTITWGRLNQERSGLAEARLRWIPEDALTFVERERKRGHYYDAILLDPPAYGVGPGGKRWQFDRQIFALLEMCRDLLSPDPLFLLLNAYAGSLSARRWSLRLSELLASRGGTVGVDALGLFSAARKQPLTTGLSVLWVADESSSQQS